MAAEQRVTSKENDKPARNWASIVDGWVREPAIRRHALIALAMVLLAALIAIGIVTGVIGQFTAPLLRHQFLLWLGGGVGLGGTGLWLRRRARRNSVGSPQHSTTDTGVSQSVAVDHGRNGSKVPRGRGVEEFGL